MTCIENLSRFIVPSDVIITLTNIYKYIGKNELYSEITKNDIHKIMNQTLERDTYYLSKLIELDVSESRARLLITKNSEARLKDEKILLNIKELLNAFSANAKRQNINSSDLNNIINFIYSNSTNSIKYDTVKEERKNYYKTFEAGSKRDIIDNIYKYLRENSMNYEPIILTINYIIDIYAIKPFTMNNDTLVYILLYLMLLKADVEAIKYISLFETIYNNKKEFDEKMNEALYNYYEGIPQISSFTRFFTDLILKMYINCDKLMMSHKEELNSNKGDNIENTIMNLNNIFTKDEIREIHPYVSESTINRALNKLKDEKIIKPLGKGRSAKWIKIGLK